MCCWLHFGTLPGSGPQLKLLIPARFWLGPMGLVGSWSQPPPPNLLHIHKGNKVDSAHCSRGLACNFVSPGSSTIYLSYRYIPLTNSSIQGAHAEQTSLTMFSCRGGLTCCLQLLTGPAGHTAQFLMMLTMTVLHSELVFGLNDSFIACGDLVARKSRVKKLNTLHSYHDDHNLSFVAYVSNLLNTCLYTWGL